MDAQAPLLSRRSLIQSSIYNGTLSPGGQAEVPSLKSMSLLPWEMVSYAFVPLQISFAFPQTVFISISLDWQSAGAGAGAAS